MLVDESADELVLSIEVSVAVIVLKPWMKLLVKITIATITIINPIILNYWVALVDEAVN